MVAASGKSKTRQDSQHDQRDYVVDGDVTEEARIAALKNTDGKFVRKLLGVVADDPERSQESDRHKRKKTKEEGQGSQERRKRATGHKKEHQALTFRRIKN